MQVLLENHLTHPSSLAGKQIETALESIAGFLVHRRNLQKKLPEVTSRPRDYLDDSFHECRIREY